MGGVGPTVKRAAFSSKEFGVSASPRASNSANPPKGGGRYQVGKPYTVRGVVYTPQENPVGYTATGSASWYGADFHGRYTANGEIFSANAITGAHPTLPLPSYARVTNKENGRSIVVRINDRGPYLPGRVMDLSYRAAAMLGYVTKGSAAIQVDYVGPAPLEGDDTRMLVASYNGPANFDTGRTQVASSESGKSLVGITTNFFNNLFSYADAPKEADAAIGTAHAAVNAMATSSPELAAWAASVDEDHRKVSMPLGIYADRRNADRLAQQFALLGAVDETATTVGGKPATQLTLTHLKPGVTADDARNLARDLGLTDTILY